jgi:hypothetical protein
VSRAARLEQALNVHTLTGPARALAEEAVLIVGRLETLEHILAGSEDEWLGVQQKLGADVATVTINAPLAEARQQALALTRVLDSLAKLTGQEVAPAVDEVDEVAAAREKRRREAGIQG